MLLGPKNFDLWWFFLFLRKIKRGRKGEGKADGLRRCGLVGQNQFKSVLTCAIDN